jgi:hypothetical protein
LEDVLFEWHYWPQAKEPFTPSELAYIGRLDADRDAVLLATAYPNVRAGALRTLKICTLLLKKAACAGLTLHDIANMMVRNGGSSPAQPVQPSVLDQLCEKASNISKWKVQRISGLLPPGKIASVADKYFYKCLNETFDNYLSELKVGDTQCKDLTLPEGILSHEDTVQKDKEAIASFACSTDGKFKPPQVDVPAKLQNCSAPLKASAGLPLNATISLTTSASSLLSFVGDDRNIDQCTSRVS